MPNSLNSWTAVLDQDRDSPTFDLPHRTAVSVQIVVANVDAEGYFELRVGNNGTSFRTVDFEDGDGARQTSFPITAGNDEDQILSIPAGEFTERYLQIGYVFSSGVDGDNGVVATIIDKE
jgi:hypothetical protein